ncbi:MAG TPA: phosphoribosylglycinamide formyltransferase [Candidatus Limnocylindria bacterium]|nr:phosphoribosylglycinamide formyltransferase [Candidatus Limnocylindria bacterium]
MRLGVLVSGRGSNLEAILAAVAEGRLTCEPALVLSNRADARALEIARGRGVATTVIDHRAHASREAFDAAVLAALRAAGIELLALAGFDRVLTPVVLDAFPERVYNVHPALLPAFKGLHAQRQALEYGVRITGATVHLVDQHVDHGPIVLQAAVAVAPDDTEASLAARILAVEHAIFPAALQLCVEGRVRIVGRRVTITGTPPPLPPPMLWLP